METETEVQITETLEMPETLDALAPFREQAKAEIAEKSERSKMSDAAIMKLRAMKEQDRLQEIDDARFANALKNTIVTHENLVKLIDRCRGGVPMRRIECRAEKLAWWIAAGFRLGHEIDSVTTINFVSELVDEEKTMSDSRFTALWTAPAAAKLRESRKGRGLIDVGDAEPVYRPCKSAKKCMKFEKRRPAAAKGRGEYCSTNCAASDRARAKRALGNVETLTVA